jgi:hypothetical protein
MSLRTKDAAMKKLILLLILMMSLGLGGESISFSNQAAAAGAPGEKPGARFVYEYRPEHQINPLDEKNHRNVRRSLPDGRTNESEVKRLRLMFLLMITLGPYRTPVQ